MTTEAVNSNLLFLHKAIFRGIYAGLSSNERILYAWLFELKTKNECLNVQLSQEQLAKYCCVSLKTIQRSIENLKYYSLISVKRMGINQPNLICVKEPAEWKL